MGPRTADKLRNAGYRTWEDIITRPDGLPVSGSRRDGIISTAASSLRMFETGDLTGLINTFPPAEHWRILRTYLPEVSYFDIETTGLDRYMSEITTVVCHHKGEYHAFFRKANLDAFLDLLDDVTLLASFNGKCFDIPYVLDAFHIPELPCPHIDLRWVFYHRGYRGGLKAIEREFGLQRDPDLVDTDGMEAVRLWRKWLYDKDTGARKKLIRYCTADVAGLVEMTNRLFRGESDE